jgi:hypothetical protein
MGTWNYARQRAPGDDERIVALYADGNPVRAIGEQTGHSYLWIWRRLRLLGVPMRNGESAPRRKRRMSATRDARIAAAYQRGMDASCIAKLEGLHPGTIRAALRRQGVPWRPIPNPQYLSARTEIDICHAYLQGACQQSVGAQFGVSGMTVSRVLRRHGVQGRPRGSRCV